MSFTREYIRDSLSQMIDSESGLSLDTFLNHKATHIEEKKASIALEINYPAPHHLQLLRQQAQTILSRIPDAHIEVNVSWKITSHAVQLSLKPLAGVRNVIAVASGKGGVGKSTTAANLAFALKELGAKVGILDADIYGPSQPMLWGLSGRPESLDNKLMKPLVAYGVPINSIGFLIDADAPAIWRGPMASQALEQLARQTDWQDLDYLIVDMPPGTGDIALTLAQKIPVVGAIIVTTPQDLALLDSRKALRMFQKVNVPVLGIIENMALYTCPQCGHCVNIFGSGGGQHLAQQYEVPWLGALPLTLSIREQADAGRSIMISEPDSAVAKAYRAIAYRMTLKVARLPRDQTHLFPNITVAS